MDKVYVLIRRFKYEGEELFGIYSKVEKAMEICRKEATDHDYDYHKVIDVADDYTDGTLRLVLRVNDCMYFVQEKDNRMNKHIEEVLNYILSSEEEDFNENASDNHVYFHAYAAFYGEISACALLDMILRKRG